MSREQYRQTCRAQDDPDDSRLDFPPPRSNMRAMRLLDRYLLRELLIPLAYCLGGFLVSWITFDLINELATFQRRQLLPRDIAEYYLVKAPELLVTIMPVALLLALLYALTNHARHHEITAIRAAGVSLWRACAVYLGVGAAFSVVLLMLNEWLVPDANEAANLVLARRDPATAGGPGPEWKLNLAFSNEPERRQWIIGAFHRETGEMRGPNFWWTLPDGSRRQLSAARGVYRRGQWEFEEVREFFYTNNVALPIEVRTNRVLALSELTETPEQIRSEIKFSELSNVSAAKRPRLSLREIRDYQRLHPALPAREAAKLETQFHGRLAEPWTCLVVVLIAIPFGAPSGRRNVFVGVAASIFIAFTYVLILQFSMAAGTGNYLPGWLAAWLPNAVFASVGAGLIQRVR
ncbi:MAG: LptF/LptG family permease [Verrucomicrobia bacterium]|nr:LptF/LptG family permease [Verrucomicrobiota bacterium]